VDALPRSPYKGTRYLRDAKAPLPIFFFYILPCAPLYQFSRLDLGLNFRDFPERLTTLSDNPLLNFRFDSFIHRRARSLTVDICFPGLPSFLFHWKR